MMNMNETIEDKINALYPMMKKSNNGSVRTVQFESSIPLKCERRVLTASLLFFSDKRPFF